MILAVTFLSRDTITASGMLEGYGTLQDTASQTDRNEIVSVIRAQCLLGYG